MVRVGTTVTDRDMRTMSNMLRPVSFLFYTLETIFNTFCLAYHIKGFMAVDMHMLTWQRQSFQYIYLVTFYVFMVITLFQSINICSGHNPTICMEIFKSCLASVAFTMISILTMWDAERDFYLMYSGKEPVEGVYVKDTPVHPFPFYMLFQSISSLACGILYMLHSTILIDVKITAHHRLREGANSLLVPINVYVLGEFVQSRLERYEWFHVFSSPQRIEI